MYFVCECHAVMQTWRRCDKHHDWILIKNSSSKINVWVWYWPTGNRSPPEAHVNKNKWQGLRETVFYSSIIHYSLTLCKEMRVRGTSGLTSNINKTIKNHVCNTILVSLDNIIFYWQKVFDNIHPSIIQHNPFLCNCINFSLCTQYIAVLTIAGDHRATNMICYANEKFAAFY